MKDEQNNIDCKGLQNCNGCIRCDNSTRCNNSTYCLYCCDLVLEKFMIFNKSVKTKVLFDKIKNKIISQLGHYKHPKNLTKDDIKWLKENITQFDKKVLDKIIEDSILSDEPKV